MEKGCNSPSKSKIVPIQQNTLPKKQSNKIIPLFPEWAVKTKNEK
jgi:hypothetical protein